MNKLLDRLLSGLFLMGQIIVHILQGKIYRNNTMEQMAFVGPASLSIALITAVFVGMVFTIQVAREFIYFGATSAVGGGSCDRTYKRISPCFDCRCFGGESRKCFCRRNWHDESNRTNRRSANP